ncbi:MAG: protein kinase, partial [Planctomycetota bacterium]
EPQQGWIVMEMMKGTLASLIARQPMPADMVRSVVQQVLTALDFLHSKNKVHGAVRPSNLLINEHGTVKLSDFEESSSDGELRAPTGSKKYLAPELIRSEFGEFGPTVDLYCLGFTALELLLGKKFNAQFPGTGKGAIDEDVAWLRWHSSDESLKSVKQLVPTCPDDLANVIDAMLHKSAAERPQSAGEVLKQLQDKPLVAVPVPNDEATESATGTTSSMLPGDAQLREWSPLNQAKKDAEQDKGKKKRKRRAAAPVAAKSSVNEFLEKPYVLWPLCALILLGALLVGWKLKQSRKKDIAEVNPVKRIEDEGGTKKPVIDTSVGVRLNILPDDSNVIIQVDGSSVEQQKEGLYRLESGMRKLTVQKSDFETYQAILSISKDQNEFDIELVRLADLTPPEPIVSIEKKKTLPTIDKPKTDPVEVVRSKVNPPEPTRKEVVEPIDHEAIARKMEKLKDESGLYEVSAALIANPDAVVDAPANEEVERLAAQFKGNAELIIDSGGFMSEISDLSFSPDGKLLAAGGEKCVRIWDMDSGQLVTTLRGDRSRT